MSTLVSKTVQIASPSLVDGTPARSSLHTATPNSNSPTSSIPLSSKHSLHSPSITAVTPTSIDEVQTSHSNVPRPHGSHSGNSISNLPAVSREYSRSGINSITSAPASKLINELQATASSSSLAAQSSFALRTTTSESRKTQRPHLYVQIFTVAATVMYHKVFIQ